MEIHLRSILVNRSHLMRTVAGSKRVMAALTQPVSVDLPLYGQVLAIWFIFDPFWWNLTV